MKRVNQKKKRKHRICLPELTYHTYSRCIEQRDMMGNDWMKNLMVEVIEMTQKKYKFELINYTFLSNHFHLIIRTVHGGATISRIMQFIKSQYTRRYNRMMDRTGPFWNERFGDTIIEYTEDPKTTFCWIMWYLGYNPVRKKEVDDPRDYGHSGINHNLDENYKSPLKLTFHKYFLDLGKTFKERVEKFLEYEEIYRKRVFPQFLFE